MGDLPRFLRRCALGAMLLVIATVVSEALPARAGEPLWLRWVRVLTAHPIRSGLALTLLIDGLIRAEKGKTQLEPARKAGQGSE